MHLNHHMQFSPSFEWNHNLARRCLKKKEREIFLKSITSSLKELKESFNYGLFYPPCNGRAGKFLDEERPLSDYPFNGPGGYLEVRTVHFFFLDLISTTCCCEEIENEIKPSVLDVKCGRNVNIFLEWWLYRRRQSSFLERDKKEKKKKSSVEPATWGHVSW